MNVLLFTSAMIDQDFADYQNEAKIKPNPSNQNFYSKLIKALALYNKVAVISLRPFVSGMFYKTSLPEEEKEYGNVKFYYVKVDVSKKYKLFNEKVEIIKCAQKAIEDFRSHNFICVTDTLRPNLVKAAKRISEMYVRKVVGMLTDNPNNLSNVSTTYIKTIKKAVIKLDGYLALTSKLVDVFDPEKPSYIFEGLAHDEEYFKKNPLYDYYFFAGSLYERYGVKNMVEAFHKSSVKAKLVIAGSGPLADYVNKMSIEDYRILYLTQLSKDKIIGYEKNALININPRPLNNEVDSESVPSKLIEYLASGVPTMSTKYPKFYSVFRDNVYWIENNDVNSIKDALEQFEKEPKVIAQKKASAARAKAFEFYGIDVQGEFITHFLDSVSSSKRS